MQRINLEKYGFVRSPEDDFSDDGTRFTCYRVGRVRVSKTVWDGDAFISGSINDSRKIDYQVYKDLPHFAAMDKLNNVALERVTPEALHQFYEDCVAYQKEFEEAEAKVLFPTIDMIKCQCLLVRKHYMEQREELENMLRPHAMDLLLDSNNSSKLSDFKYYYNGINRNIRQYDPESYPETIKNSYLAVNFVKADAYQLADHYYFEQAKECLNSLIKRG